MTMIGLTIGGLLAVTYLKMAGIWGKIAAIITAAVIFATIMALGMGLISKYINQINGLGHGFTPPPFWVHARWWLTPLMAALPALGLLATTAAKGAVIKLTLFGKILAGGAAYSALKGIGGYFGKGGK